MTTAVLTRTLDEELTALVATDLRECLVCGEEVQIAGERVECTACGSILEPRWEEPTAESLLPLF